jgi:hypothetical protein
MKGINDFSEISIRSVKFGDGTMKYKDLDEDGGSRVQYHHSSLKNSNNKSTTLLQQSS